MKWLVALFVVVALTTASVEASPHGGISRLFNSLAPSDWFEASGPDANCDEELPDDETGDDGSTDSENENDDDDDDTDNDAGGVEFDALRKEAEAFTGLFNDDICADAAVGESKCVCIRRRGFASLFRGSGHDLRCGVCSLRFITNRRNNSNLRNRDDDDDDDEDTEDFFSK